MIDVLARGWPVKKGDSKKLRAALRLVVDFDTWRALARSGLDDHGSANLAAQMVMATFAPEKPG